MKQTSGDEEILRQLLVLEQTIAEKEQVIHVSTYGLPDLLFPKGYEQGIPVLSPDVPEDVTGANIEDGWYRAPLPYPETDEQYKERQNQAIEDMITKHLKITKDGKVLSIVMIPAMHEFVSDVFYRRKSRVIVWKPRGGGGSLSAAILIFLLMTYQKRDILDVSGSGEQALCVYNYVRVFCDLIPGFDAMLQGGGTNKTRASFLNGGSVLCAPATEKQVRGKHKSVLVIDEACEDQREEEFRAALQGALSEEDPIIVLLSTFHLPSGFYQECWDEAEKLGFERIRWSVIDTMAPCKKWMEYVTSTDPDGMDFCMNRCPFTVSKEVVDASGQLVVKDKIGCKGSGRNAQGWLSYDRVLEAYKINIGTNKFEIEWLCARPNYENSIYSPEVIEDAISIPLGYSKADEFAVGIDWGIETSNSLAITLVARQLEHIYVHECLLSDHKLVKDVAEILNHWMDKIGKRFPVLTDASHPFNNAELSQAGFDVRPVNFGTWKKFGIQNLSKFLIFRRIKISNTLTVLIEQLKKFRRDKKGGIVKKDDHGADSLMVAVLNWKFEDEFGEDVQRARILDPAEQFTKKRDTEFTFDGSGIAPPVALTPPRHELHPKMQQKGGVLVF